MIAIWVFLLCAGAALAADHPEALLWSHGAPGSEGKTAKEVVEAPNKDHGYLKVTEVHKPSLTVYLPPADKATGAAMIVAPGGGHRFLNFDQEGTYVAEYLNSIGMDAIAEYEHGLLSYGMDALLTVPGLRLIGTARDKASVLSFTLDGIHPHDIGTVLDQEGIAIRTGHHCAQPVMDRFGVPATARASLAFYNTREEIDKLVAGLHKVLEVLG